MSDPTVTAFLTKLLCSHGGRLAKDLLTGLLDLPTEQIEQILRDEPQKFSLVGELVLARNPVRICAKYLKNESEEECDKLHLCRHYLQGKCWPGKRPPCLFSHDILSDHNRTVSKSNQISGLNEDEMKVLLLQNDNQLLPEVCVKYLHDTCDLGTACPRLHICGFFTRGECNRHVCKRSHHLLEFGSDLLIGRCRKSEVSIQNFQMLSMLKHSERLQSLKAEGKKEYKKGHPAAARGRGRGRPRNRKNCQDGLQNKNRGRQETTRSHSRGRSGSRPMSESGDSHLCWSEEVDDGDEAQKTRIPNIMDDGLNSSLRQSDNRGAGSAIQNMAAKPYSIVQPLMSLGNLSGHLSSTPSPSAPPPKPTTTPLTAAGPANAPPVNVPMEGRSVSQEKPAVNSSTVAPTPSPRPSQLVVSPPKDPPVPAAKPVTTPVPSPYSPQPATTIKPVASSTASPPRAPPTSYYSYTRSPTVPLEKPVTSPIPSPYSPQPVATINPVASSVPSPYSPQPVATINPVASSVPSPYSRQPVTTINPVASPVPSPPSAPPTSYYYSPTKVPPVPQEKPVQSRVWSPSGASFDKLNASVKPITRAEPKDVYDNLYLNEDLDDFVTIKPSHFDHQADKTSLYGAPYVSQKRTDPDKVPEICLHDLWKHCKLGRLCPDMHYYLPYRWQIYKGGDWEDISNMEDTEKDYCDPKVDRIPLVDFLTMRSGMHRVRRLSTVSSVTKPTEYVLTTEWLWNWKDEYGTWRPYGQLNVKHVSSTILSSDLENIYLADPTAVIPFSAGPQRYEINFREMKQKNILYKTEKDVRRRPKFLSFEDVKLLKGSSKSSSAASKSPLRSGTSTLKTGIYPRTWDAEAMPDIGCQKVSVSTTSSEFSEIFSSFAKTVNGHVVKTLWRLQNPSLWQVFQWQKEQMKKVNKGQDVKENRLFHGTDKTHVDAICNQNFDWRICGTHGTVYGQGSYFARDASYSHNYSTPTSSGKRLMFVARVLVGDYVTGNPQMKRPPERCSRSAQCYDSCVDNIINPSIFVVFEKHQIYPEYLLEYEEEKKSCAVC
ncbi:zinc finger CCCH-type antiviral protein 1-like isoform X2 [Rhinoderma darwinii]|uniref:zinc finger CCCH-type antiviral protein 1-like isoform X2 n=1 Tax=Rhinoderma darwinii TaxID=43563 RepID=UPI003F66E1CB